jgi:hypothetical protein
MAAVAGLQATTAVAQPAPDPVQTYRSEQAFKTQDLRALNKSLLTDEVQAEFKQYEGEYRQLISRGVNPGNSREMSALRAGLKYRVFILTDPETQANVPQLAGARNSLARDLKGAGRSISNKDDRTNFRRLVCGEVLPLLEQCLTANLTSRSLAIGMLPDLEVVSSVPGSNVRIEIHDQVDELFVKILQDKEQTDTVKARAAHEIRRMLVKADNVPQVQLLMANAMVNELARAETDWEYQFCLVEALGKITAPREVTGQQKRATVIQALAEAAQDPRRDILVRCAAASGLGKAGFDGQIKFEPLAWKTVQLAIETGLTIGKDPRQPVERRQLCGWYLYLAFHHEDQQGQQSRQNPQGFLNRDASSASIRDGYQAMLPIAKALMFETRPVADGDILNASNWLDNNKPASLVYDAVSPALKP